MNNFNELISGFVDVCEYEKIDAIPEKDAVELPKVERLNCGLFKLRGLTNYIEFISTEINFIEKKDITNGIKEITIKPKSIEEVVEIIKKYPFAKVTGLCTYVKVYSMYSESGYPYITEIKEHGYIDKTLFAPWYWNDSPDRKYLGRDGGFYNFLYTLQWENDIFMHECEGCNYKVFIKDNSQLENIFKEKISNDETLKFYSNDWKIKKDGKNYILVEYIGHESNVFIPGMINKCNVIIDSYVFSKTYTKNIYEHNENIRNIYIGDGCIELKENAFTYCPMLQNIRIPKTVKKFGTFLFSGSNRLKHDLVIGDTLINCADTKNETYELDCSIKNINYGAFDGVLGIKNFIFHKNAKKIYDLPEYVENIIFPDELESISEFRITMLKVIKKIDLPSRITMIPGCFLSSLPMLEELIIPDSVEIIEDKAFSYIDSLKKTSNLVIDKVIGPIMPKGLKELGWNSFYGRVTVFDKIERFVSDSILKPSKSILLNVCSSEDNSLLYRVWVSFKGESESLVSELMTLWNKETGWNFVKYDELYSKYKSVENKFFHVICRLRYPIDLDSKKKNTYMKFYNEKKEEVLPLLEQNGYIEALEICKEIDEA